ncbi:unnamed protein product [Toxocara canis]|uniref:G protein-coupled receptor n=1 Tax=Toxocara canis TaxID=6265 RepID=A0A183UYV4_TOXCA|nr:unnamed protein product [Toxocara canis]
MFIVIDYVVFLLTTTIAFLVFCALWIAFIVGMFVVCRSALRARFSSLTCNFIAFALSSSCLFELLRMHRQRRLMQQMFLENGPPVDCLGLSFFTSLFSSYSCLEYYEVVHSCVFWQLNVFFVTAHLFSDISVVITNAV